MSAFTMQRKSTKKAASGDGSAPATTRSKRASKPFAVSDVTVQAAEDDARAQSDDENVVLNLRVFGEDESDNDGVVEAYDCCHNSDFMGGVDNYLDNVFNDNGDISSSVGGGGNGDGVAFSNVGCDINTDNNEAQLSNSLKVIDLLKDFEEKNKHNEWPTNTSIHCYWCCHKFNNTPFGIPVKYINDRFHVYGCFCSLECCAAHNMDSKDSSDDIWERSSLINMLAGYKNHIKPAPSRLALKIFGGHMDIEQFREYCNSNKIMNINFPPMLTMTQQIEEINASDISNDYRYVPIDTNRIDKYKEKIKLKRNKPITNFKNTLDHTMNLKYDATGATA
jgi:hypothetical protein